MGRISAVYAICNHVTGEAYIGASWNVAKRWKQHQYHLVRGSHHNAPLQQGFLRTGHDGVALVILERLGDEGIEHCSPHPNWLKTERRRLARARAVGIVLYNDQVRKGRRVAA